MQPNQHGVREDRMTLEFLMRQHSAIKPTWSQGRPTDIRISYMRQHSATKPTWGQGRPTDIRISYMRQQSATDITMISYVRHQCESGIWLISYNAQGITTLE